MKPLALVTGASRGIGAAIAETLAGAGFRVAIHFRSNREAAVKVLEKIRSQKGEGFLCDFDLADGATTSAGMEALVKEHGPLQVLVNNAGVTGDQLILRQSEAEIDRLLNTNLKGPILVTRDAIKSMIKAKKGGSIIFISSVVGETGNAGQSVYSASKAALLGFAKSLAREVASRQIRVNVVTPGFIRTDMTENLTEAQKESILRSIPLETLGEAADIAHAVRFLATNESRYITGQVLGVNGGMYM